MAKQGCIKIKLDESNYSSPVPVIGLYIAAASLLCSLAMLYDIFSGFRHSKPLLPCRWFSLNSLTLTLLSVAAKVPLDLTTSMPGDLDQFSKLSGTTLVCVSMGFFMPSLGINQNSEGLQNMASLTILVVTIFVNVCIQISTRVIVKFIGEHIIIMCCMFFLLLALWVSALDINKRKGMCTDHNKDLLTKSEGSMLQRLKLAYLYGYNSNPQFILCRQPNTHLVGVLCLFCFFVTMRAFFSFLTPDLCGGYSAYAWSMRIIVVTQIPTLIIGGYASTFRSCFSLVTYLRFNPIGKVMKDEIRSMMNSNPLLVSDYFGEVLNFLMMLQTGFVICIVIIPLGLIVSVTMQTGFLVSFLFAFPVYLILIVLWRLRGRMLSFNTEHQGNGDTLEYIHLIQEGDMEFHRWSLGKSLTDMKKWVEISKNKCGNHLTDLLLKTPPSEPSSPMELDVSSLSMVLLVRIAAVVIPSTLSGPLVHAYNEADETVRYVDDKIISLVGENRTKSRLARAVRVGDDFSSREIFKMTNPRQSELDRALEIILRLKNTLPSDVVWKEVGAVSRFILCREYTSIEELYSYMEQMFVNMLHKYLSQIPNAIFKELTESPAEEFDVRTRVALKLLCRFEPVEALIQWSFPVQCNISSLITAQDPSTQSTLQDPSAQSALQDPPIQNPIPDHSVQSPSQNPSNEIQSPVAVIVGDNATVGTNPKAADNLANNGTAVVVDVIVQIDNV